MYPHFMSVILRSDGAELLGALSTATSYSRPKFNKGVAAKAEVRAALERKFLLDDILIFFWLNK
jgi:hypothetical protein